MMNTELKPVSGSAVNRPHPCCLSNRRRAPKPGGLTPAPSLRLPATPQNRARLRILRQAELRAWNRACEPDANAALRAEVTRTARAGRRESRLFAGVVAVAVIALALGALASLRFVQHHDDFVALVRRLLGAA